MDVHVPNDWDTTSREKKQPISSLRSFRFKHKIFFPLIETTYATAKFKASNESAIEIEALYGIGQFIWQAQTEMTAADDKVNVQCIRTLSLSLIHKTKSSHLDSAPLYFENGCLWKRLLIRLDWTHVDL